jgi:hypothetical protein
MLNCIEILFVAALSSATTCQFTTDPVTKDIGTGLRSWVWTEPYQPSLFQDGLWQADAAYETYTAWLNTTIPRDFGGLDPFDQRACLKHQRAIFKNVGYDTHDWDVILNGTVGGIFRMNCIESLLWGKQNKYHPQTKSATEFGAYILLDRKNTTVKVYLQTGPTLGVPGMSWVNSLMQADLESDFSLLTFLHLHPFDAANVKYQDCAGTCIPSSPDLNAFASDLKAFACETAWITNGASSFRFPLTQLGLFNGAGSGSSSTPGRVRNEEERPEIYRGEW